MEELAGRPACAGGGKSGVVASLGLWTRTLRAPFFQAVMVPTILGSSIAWYRTGVFHISSIASAISEMTRSEITQTLCRDDIHVTEEKYLSIIEGKTACLLSCACRVGAMLGESRNGEVDVLSNYGRNLGMAFQITDDLLDITCGERRMGKSPGNDFQEGRITLPLIHTLGVAESRDREWLKRAFGEERVDDAALERVRDMVRACGGVEYSVRKAEEYGSVCKEQLERLKESACRNSLAMLADYVACRAN